MCVVCGSNQWVDLPQVGPQSMASDWRVLPEPLQKRACNVCGLVSSATPARAGFFERGYSLYAHPLPRNESIEGSSCTRAGSLTLTAASRSHRSHSRYSTWVAAMDRFFSR
jgi:hypothetical protein